MIKKKNGFFTFCCSLIPGAGEMYLGFMKEGISVMLLMMGAFMLTSFFRLDVCVYLLPVIWFYSFFNVHNKASLSDEEFYALEDDYLFHMDRVIPQKGQLSGKQTTIFAWILILLGVSILWGSVIREIVRIIGHYVSETVLQAVEYFLYHLPQYAIAVFLIAAGVYLIRHKKEELDQEERKEN